MADRPAARGPRPQARWAEQPEPRLCEYCGYEFEVPRWIDPRGHSRGFSLRKTCPPPKRCEWLLRGEVHSELHRLRRIEDPEGYRRWMKRDFVAMGRRAAMKQKVAAKRLQQDVLM